MTAHDPLCEMSGWGSIPDPRCECPTIRAARADERQRIFDGIGKDREITARVMDAARADERKRIEKFAIPAWREEIAQEIEALLDGTDMSRFGYPQGVTDAAHIARGEQP